MKGRERAVTAVTFNLKEQRVLEKTIQTIGLEQSHSAKLLELDHRVIRISYKRLKDRVSRIKSYLSAEHIAELRQLDLEGKLKPELTSVNFSGALKIAAAARRLKLGMGPTPIRRPATAAAAMSRHARPRLLDKRGTEPERPHSVTGVFTDVSDSADGAQSGRPSSVVGVIQTGGTRLCKSNITIASPETEINQRISKSIIRPMTSIGHPQISAQVARRQRPNRACTATTKTRSLYSSHDLSVSENDTRLSRVGVPSATSGRSGAMSIMSDSTIESNLGEDLRESVFKGLLIDEQANGAEIEEKRREFLGRLGHYIKANPSIKINEAYLQSLQAHDEESTSPSDYPMSAQMRIRIMANRITKLDYSKKITGDEYARKLVEHWKDITKCRYLRIPDDLVDLSGITTLAMDQMKLFGHLRRVDSKQSFLPSVQSMS